MLNLCVFSSGAGSNFIELNKFSNKNNSKIHLRLLISNNSSCGAVEYAKKNHIKIKIINKLRYPNYDQYINEILSCLIKNKINFIALAGYLKKIPIEIIEKYRIINIHPSLLPQFGGKGFYGINVHKAVILSGVKKTGVTIHIVNKDYDKGPILFQEEISVLKGDTADDLASRVLKVEHRIYKKVIKLIIDKKIQW